MTLWQFQLERGVFLSTTFSPQWQAPQPELSELMLKVHALSGIVPRTCAAPASSPGHNALQPQKRVRGA